MTTNNLTAKSQARRAQLHNIFEEYLSKLGLRQTRQRKIILDAVLSSPRHVDAETIALVAKTLDKSIGLATVYRTLKMMTDAKILIERRFTDARACFEFSDEEHHHDHLICNQCGEIVEFLDESIENRQVEIARNLGFNLVRHKMELFADCLNEQTCFRKDKKNRE
jgi:Fur family ferric uptake transcriptional regulator